MKIADFPIEAPISSGCPIATFNNQRVASHSYGKWIEVFIGESFINDPFSIAMFDYQRVYHGFMRFDGYMVAHHKAIKL